MSFLPPHSQAPLKKIKKVQFGILSPEQTRIQSVAKIEHVELLEKGLPKSGGLADHRMGCIEKNMRCYSCNSNMVFCPGHFGHIELESPVYHVGFIKMVKKILECVCPKCARFRLLPTDPKYADLGRVADKFRFAWDIAKGKKKECPYEECSEPFQPLKRVGVQLYIADKKNGDVMLSAENARKILERISDDTCRVIGLDPIQARPEWMILTVLPVAPPCVRPSVNMDINGRGEDDLTHVYSNIIRYNNQLKKRGRRDAGRSIADLKEQLQIHVTSLIDNDVAGVPQTFHKGGRPINSVSIRLKSKTGRIRGNIMGKRVDFSARTVITGDPNISIGEVGVPFSIATNLTFPERVTQRNLAKMQALVNRGPEYPSGNYVIKGESNLRIDLRSAPRKPVLTPGDVVERHMITGDLVLFNRQPTLHKMSMMAHRVRVMSGQTFRLNVNVCASYNADFDGDEMNLHFPQTLEAMAELEALTTVSRLLVSPQASKPVNALVQDSLMGVRKLTKRDTFLQREEVMELMLHITGEAAQSLVLPCPTILRPHPLWTGKQIMTMILPELDLVSYHSTHPDDESEDSLSPGDTRVLIQGGVHLTGIISKKAIGATAGGLMHIIYNDHGHEAAREFLDNAAQVVNQWLVNQGFSVGLGDAIVSAKTAEDILQIGREQHEKAAEVLADYETGVMIPQGNLSLEETKEQKMQMCLAKERDLSGKLANQRLHAENNVKQMVEAGSKGGILNLCQISACVGQQSVEGKRIALNFGGRTLPHFTKGDDSADARGYVSNSFLRGLRPEEMFFHAMGGREGLIDTAVKTAETGYIQRRLIKAALEDIIVSYDGTVRDSRGNIIQFTYGDDGFDGVAIENQVFETMLCSDDIFYARYHMQHMDEEFALLTEERAFLRNVMRQPEDRWPMPLNLKRLIGTALREQVKVTANDTSLTTPATFDPQYIFTQVMGLRSRLRPSRFKLPNNDGMCNPTKLFHILLLSTFSSKQVLHRHKLNKNGFDWVLKKIEDKFHRGLINPAESVGVLAAQSIGEPATQMTLNTFHLSGTGNKTVTSGIPRLKEVINVSKNIKTPGMTVHLLPPYNTSKKDAERIKIQLQHASLNDIITMYQIQYDPDYRNSNLLEDRSWMNVQTAVPDEDAPEPDTLHPWVFRISFSRKELYVRDLTMSSIADKILETFDAEFYVMHSDDNNEHLTMHIRLYKDLPDPKSLPDDEDMALDKSLPKQPVEVDGNTFFDLIKNELLTSVTVCGVPGIEKTFISKKQFPQIDPDTGVLASTGKEYVIETDGINMRDCIYVEGVDPYRLTCNDPRDILSMYGVELAREVLLDEIRAVTEGGGTIINYRHLSLLCDVMTHRGQLMAITRHGIRRTDAGPLMKCTFEQTVDILNDAAMRGRSDDVQGVAENVMLGAIAPLGTGMMDILLDQEQLSKCVIVENDRDTLPPPVPPTLPPPSVHRNRSAPGGYNPLQPSYMCV